MSWIGLLCFDTSAQGRPIADQRGAGLIHEKTGIKSRAGSWPGKVKTVSKKWIHKPGLKAN